ncbi:MAG: FAD-dependent oxidoreductase [Deltaproteobacteria bacterium]|nr:FAD-dependent oxidoreductase [Deltaproteobacteria bacterium]
MNYTALVVGAGVAGVRAALDLAEAGNKVALIDKSQGLGGVLIQLDRQFPSDRCGMCQMLPLVERDACSQYCLRKGLYHENIDLMLSTELTAVEGEPGKLHVTLRKKSTFVNPNLCIGCGECAAVCPVQAPDEFNAGLTLRPAVHLPAPYTIPNHYVVDLDSCQRCWACFKACPTGAIDFRFEARSDFKILMADPDPSTKDNLEAWLKDEIFPLDAAGTGAEALEKMAQDGSYRLVLLDMDLPDMPLEEALDRMQEQHPGLPVVLMAAPGEIQAAQKLLAHGALEVLAKPLEEEVLVPWLDKLYLKLESDEEFGLEVGSVILAAGFECFKPSEAANLYGYGALPGVVTAVEFERMASGTGPHRGELLIPGSSKPARRIAWLQCVGSREPRIEADFCSSVCCMFSIKEAVMAKEITQGRAEAVIFYMDMRTFGKDFERYRDRAETEFGVKFRRTRVHSVASAEGSEGLQLDFLDAAGKRRREIFDLVVLAVGARPAADMEDLLEITGAKAGRWGFCETSSFASAQTGRLGIFAAGTITGPKDISESVIQAGAAAMEASRLVIGHEELTAEAAEPVYRDVSLEMPRTLVALCTSCRTLEKGVDLDALRKKLSGLHSVQSVIHVKNMCTQMGWWQLEKEVRNSQANRILLGACQPFVYEPKMKELGRKIELNPSLMSAVDIFTPTFPGLLTDAKAREQEIFATLNTGLVRLLGANPAPVPSIAVTPRALVVGGGAAGLTAALSLAEQGLEVDLVEKDKALGGVALTLQYTLNGDSPQEYLLGLIEQIKKHPKISVFLSTRVVASRGSVGRFVTTVKTEDGESVDLKHGAVILATGGRQGSVTSYGYGQHETVITQAELEQELTFGNLDPTTLTAVVMIQCVESRQEPHLYCSRVCCLAALKNALFLKKKNPNLPIFIFYRDMMAYGLFEAYYTRARQAGVIFIPYDVGDKPRANFEGDRPLVTARDPVLDMDIQIRPDLLILAPPIVPHDVHDLAEIFGVELNQDGFFQEAESKWRPVECLKQGIFLCGTALSPRSVSESIASAEAAAGRALSILSKEMVAGSAVTAVVRFNLCSRCELCISVCPYGARSLDPEDEKIVVDELLCQGCGSCAAVCPNSATVLRGFHDREVMGAIDAALEGFI